MTILDSMLSSNKENMEISLSSAPPMITPARDPMAKEDRTMDPAACAGSSRKLVHSQTLSSALV